MQYEVKTVGGKVQEIGGQPVVAPKDYVELSEPPTLGYLVIGIGACAVSGFIVGLIVGLVL